jgi:hypothetical protein
MRLGLVAAALLLIAAAPVHPPLFDEEAWTVHAPDLAHRLTRRPAECLAASGRLMVEIGRALFRSPGLIGGPAARLGLSCNACHPNGHTNPAFFLPELTDTPGMADVTAEWASAVRGDGIMNPVPIPDLTGVGAKPSFGHKHEPSLTRFAAKVIEEEFQGAPPPAQAFDGVIAYLKALDPQHCPARAEDALSVETAADDVRRPLAAAPKSNAATAKLLLLAAQEAMGRLADRLPESHFGAERKALEELARELGGMRAAGRVPEAGWSARFDALTSSLRARESDTYFDEATLRASLQTRPEEAP